MRAAPDSSEGGPPQRDRPTAANAAAAKPQVRFQRKPQDLGVVSAAPNVDWCRTLVRYLAGADDPVSAWLKEAAGQLGGLGPDVPTYGSVGWTAAPGPLRLASALRAAEAWRRAGLFAAEDLADDLDAAAPEAQLDAADTAHSWGRLARWVADNRNAPSFGELQARCGVPVLPVVPAW